MSESEPTDTTAPEAEPETPKLVRHGWNPPVGGAWGWINARRVRRFLITVAGVGLLAWFGWLVWAPFQHPRVHVVCLSGGDYRVLKAPPLAFTAEDIAGLATLPNLFDELIGRAAPEVWDSLAEPAKLQTLGARLNGIAQDPSDTVLLVVSAHGTLDDDEPYLVCRNFDPANPRAGRLSVDDFLGQIRACKAGKKVLILDLGRIEDDPRLGFIWNDFSRRVMQAVRDTQDESLWLLTANGTGQRSQLAPSIDRSVFGYALEHGLAGGADLNGDQVIALSELHRYTSATVADWVTYVSKGADQQQPRLAWGGENVAGADSLPAAARDVILAPVPSGFDPQDALTLADQVKLARKSSRGEAWNLAQTSAATPTVKSAAVERPGAKPESKPGADVMTSALSQINVANVRSTGQLKSQAEMGARQAGETVVEQAVAKAPQADATTAAPNDTAPAASAAPAASSQAAETTAPATASANAPASPAATDPAEAAKAAARVVVPKKFAEAWRLRDQIAALPVAARPRAYAAQFWRELQQSLIGYELQYRAGRIGNTKTIGAALDRIIAGEKLLLESATNANILPTETGPAQMLRFRPWAARELDGASSAAMEQLIDVHAGRVVTPEVKGVVDVAPAITDNREAFFAHWNALPPGSRNWAEVRGAQALEGVPEQHWAVTLQAWRAMRASETLSAAGPWLVPWARTELDAADALRWQAERELLDAIGADYATKAAQLLDQAMTRYQSAAELLDNVAEARELQQELLERAPEYLRLQLIHRHEPKKEFDARCERFSEFQQDLGELSDLLETPDVARASELRKLTDRLLARRRSLELPLATGPITELTTAPAQAGDSRQVASLLETTLPPADTRLKLLSIVSRLDGRLISDLKPPANIASYRTPAVDPVADGEQIVNIAGLHDGLLQLSSLQSLDGGDAERKVHTALYDLRNAQSRMTMVYPATIEAFDRQLGVFQTALSDALAAMPGRLAAAAQANQDLREPSTRSERVIALRRIERAMRLIDGRDARRTGDVPVSGLVDAAAWHELLTWHADRAARAAAESSGDASGYWTDAAAAYRAQASRLLESDTSHAPAAPSLVLNGPASLDLAVLPEQEATFTLKHTGANPEDVWLTLYFDPEVVQVDPQGAFVWYREQDLGRDAGDEGLLARDASLRMNPGQEVTLRLQAHSRSRAAQPARVNIRAVSRESSARRTLSVNLPTTDTVDLAIDGVPDTWSHADGLWLLSPFPNRDNRYRWALTNHHAPTKEVKVELCALERPLITQAPAGSLSAAEAAEFLDSVGTLRPLATAEKMSIPAGETPIPIPFPAPPADAPPPAAGAPPPELPHFEHGLLLLVTDLANARVSLHRIEVAPQRPRRFVIPRVRYNAIDERIEINLSTENPAAMPTDPVRVSCQVVEPLPPGTQARLSDEMRAPDYTASLWISAPLDPARVVTFTLSVDDYPRAFTFRVPCQESGREIPPENNLLAARIKTPAIGAAYLAPAGPIDVVAEFDLPRAAEDDPRTLIELGFDTDRDRDFGGEATTRLPGDRQVEIQLVSAGPGGAVTIKPEVSDFDVPLTPPGLVNNRVGVLARVTWGDETAWSESREIILDGTAPSVERVRVKPSGVAEIGGPLEASCLALDGDLSGVASVEMTIDQLGTAEFEGNLPPVPAKFGADRRWTAKLDSAPLGAGTYHILVRAKDKVGNESAVNSSAVVRLMTKETLAAERQRATNRVSGTLLYGNSGFAGINVRLESLPADPAEASTAPAAAPPAPIAPVATDEQGTFLFDRVPPGKYKLTAEGVVRNKTRRAEAEVTVDPAPTAVRPLRLELR